MRIYLGLGVLAILICGCQSREDVVGRWKYGRDTVDFHPDHTFLEKDPKGEVGGMWMLSGKNLSLTPETVGGKPLSEFRSTLLSKVKKASSKSQFNAVLDSWLASNEFKLNSDGISMDIVDPSGKRRDSMMRNN